jgi:dolichol-phosphate mannosyltransferase
MTLLLKKRPGVHIAAVIPAFNVAKEIGSVLRALPALFTTIVVVNDGSADETGALIDHYAELDSRVVAIHHERNGGVGAAMISGYRKAMESGADIVVQVDGDGQMPLWLVPALIEPLLNGEADYTKGNRFRDFATLRQMPLIRRIGNVALSFLAKAATGYWNLFDPSNGFTAVRADVLSQVPLHKVDRTYFFETSMLSHLYVLGAVVKEVQIPSRYAGETSSLSIPRVLRQFPLRLLMSLVRRIVLKNYVYDFNLESLNLACGLPLFVGGILYGGINWYSYSTNDLAAPTGTVVLPALAITLGMQFLLSAAHLDLSAVPREPVNGGPIAAEGLARRQVVAVDKGSPTHGG